MKNKGIFFSLFFAIFLGCLFQYMRVDGFLSFGSFHNLIQQRQSAAATWADADSIPRDTYIIYYDPSSVTSMYARHNVETMLDRQKKAYESCRVDGAEQPIPQSVCGVLIATDNPGRIRNLNSILTYADKGGTVMFLQRLASWLPEAAPPAIRNAMGIRKLGTNEWIRGMEIRTPFVLGGKGFSVGKEFETEANDITLTGDATVEIASTSGIPLLWTRPYGAGQIIAYNGNEPRNKSGRGLLAAMLFHAGSDAIYPVVGVKLFYLDDFPAPIPRGREKKIYEDTGLNTKDFYRNEWWPFVRKLAETYDLRLTGGIIATYNDQVQGPFPSDVKDGRNSLIRYGRELLNRSGELALHGYNHQPLTLDPKGLRNLGYRPWPDEKTMEASLEALYQYSRSVYPEYVFRVYIAPSNIIDENGIHALRKAVPSVRILSSSYDESSDNPQYVQDFRRRKDDLYDLPRISSGHKPSALLSWEVISALNDIGVFSHFIHPDEILFEDEKNIRWSEMKVGLDMFLRNVTLRFPWLKPVTASGSLPYFDAYFDVDYRVLRTPAYLELHAWGHRQEVCFLLRTKHRLDHTEDCTAERIDQDVYLVCLKGKSARLYWKDDAS